MNEEDVVLTPSRKLPVRFQDELYPRLEDQAALDEVYKSYMRGADLLVAAAAQGMEENTIKYIARKYKWVDDKMELDGVLIKDSERRLSLMRAQKVNQVVSKTVAVQSKLVNLVNKAADNKELTPSQLKNLSETAKNASDSSLRALGIGESGASASQEIALTKQKNKQPLVLVFQGGGLPPVRRSEEQTITTVEIGAKDDTTDE